MKDAVIITIGCLILLIATFYKEELIALDHPDDPYTQPSSIYQDRGDELLTDTIYNYEQHR